MDLHDRVDMAIALLDEKGPAGWVDLIDLHEFDIDDVTECILGQIYGSYWKGLEFLGISDAESNHLCFITPTDIDISISKDFEEVWTEKIIERRKQTLKQDPRPQKRMYVLNRSGKFVLLADDLITIELTENEAELMNTYSTIDQRNRLLLNTGKVYHA